MRPWPALLLVFAAAAFADDGKAPESKPAVPAAPDAVKSVLERCRYTPAAFEMKVRDPIRFGDKVVLEKLEFPSAFRSVDPERNDVVRAKLFRTAEPQPAVVVFLSGWRFDPMTPELAARFAGETGIQALSIDLPFQGERTPKGKGSGDVTFSADLAQNEATLVQAALDVERALDWLVRERKVDPKRIGVLGTSLGGFLAGNLYGMSERFSCGVMLLAGGDVASVIFNNSFLTADVRSGLEQQGIDEKACRERMKPLDPITWARKERRDGLLLLAAERDEVVPLATVKALAEAYGGARLVVLQGATHIQPSAVRGQFAEVVKHFTACLGAKTPETQPATK